MAQVLVVCTGNICRSPMAEGFLRGLFMQRIHDEEDIAVASAGTSAWDGSPATPEAVAAAAEREADISTHRARRVRSHHVEEAGLVLAMTSDHLDRVLQLSPRAAARSFTLKELVQLLEAMPEPPADGTAADRLRSRVAAADQLRLEGFEPNVHDLDVADPIGMSIDTYRAVAWEVDGLCVRLVDLLLGATPADPEARLTAMWKDGE